MRTTQLQILTTTAIVALACVAPTAAAASDSPADVDINASVLWVDIEFPAWVEVPWEDGTSTVYSTEVVSLCTGFFVSTDGDIATAGHCVEADATTESAARNQVVQDLEWEGWDVAHLDLATLAWTVEIGEPTAYVGQPSGITDGIFSGQDSMIAQIVDYQGFEKGDNALLRVADLGDTPGLPISETTPQVGDRVTSVGFAGSVSHVSDYRRQLPSHKSGTVSSRQYTSKGVANTEIDAAVTQGMSGGPTLGEDGTVIGVNSFGIHGESQAFNFVTDTESLSDFLTRNGVDLVAAPVPASDTAPELEAEPLPAETLGTDDETETSSGPVSGGTDTPVPPIESLTEAPAPATLDEAGVSPLAWAAVGLGAVFLLTGGAVGGRYLARTRQHP